MTITLELPPDVEAQFQKDASEHGMGIQDFMQEHLYDLAQAQKIDYGKLFSRPVTREEQEALEAVLQSFDEGDADEQRETLTYLRNAVNEDRLSYRDRFAQKAPQ